MRRMDVLAAVMLVSLLLVSCSRKQYETSVPLSTGRLLHAPPPAGPGSTFAAAKATLLTRDRKLVRTVNLELVARDPEAVARQIQAVAARLGGYVTASTAQRDGDAMHCGLTLRVPADRLDDALGALRKLAVRVNRESQQVDDVTEQAVDLDARLRTLQATEKELLALLSESRARQSKAADVMAIYSELTEIRTRIEQFQGQKQTLERQVAFSTVVVDLVPEEVARPVVRTGWRPGETLHLALRGLVAGLRGLFNVAVFLVVVILPLGFLAALPVWFVVRMVRRARRKTT